MSRHLPPPLLLLIDPSSVPGEAQAHSALSKAVASWATDVLIVDRSIAATASKALPEPESARGTVSAYGPESVGHLPLHEAVVEAIELSGIDLRGRLICLKGSVADTERLEAIQADLRNRGAALVHADGTDLYGAPFMTADERSGARPALYDRANARAIDLISTVSGRCLYSGDAVSDSPAQLEILPVEVIAELEVAAARSLPERCDRGAFIRALEMLPPTNWGHFEDVEIFQVSETYKAGVTATYARAGEKYFTWRAPIGLSHKTLADELRGSAAWAMAQQTTTLTMEATAS